MLYVGKVGTIFPANSNERLLQAGLCVKFTSGSEDLIIILPPDLQKSLTRRPLGHANTVRNSVNRLDAGRSLPNQPTKRIARYCE